MPQELDLKTLGTLNRMMGFFQEGAMTKPEAEKFLKTIMEFVLKLDKRQEQEIQTLRQAVQQLMTKIESNFDIKLTEMRKEVDSLFVSDRVKKIEEDHGARMRGVDERVAKIKDGYTPKKGKDFFDGKPGIDGHKLTPEEVVDKVNQSEELIKPEQIEGLPELLNKVEIATKQEARRVISGPSANSVLTENITSQCDGSNRTFQVPKFRTAHFVISHQAPFLFVPGVHFTQGNGQIIMDNSVEAFKTDQATVFHYTK